MFTVLLALNMTNAVRQKNNKSTLLSVRLYIIQIDTSHKQSTASCQLLRAKTSCRSKQISSNSSLSPSINKELQRLTNATKV